MPDTCGNSSPTIVPTSTQLPSADTIFGASCNNNTNFTLLGRVYPLPENTQILPDFNALTPSFEICPSTIDISARNFNSGFPGVENLLEWFAIKLEGGLLIATTGEYIFNIISDDGSKLWIDSNLIIDNDGLHGPKSLSSNVTLDAGKHKIVVEYFQGPKDQIALQLFWKAPNGTTEIIPSSAFVKF